MQYDKLMRICGGSLYLGWKLFNGKPTWRQRQLLLKAFSDYGNPAPKDVRKRVEDISRYYSYRDPIGYCPSREVTMAMFTGLLAYFIAANEEEKLFFYSFDDKLGKDPVEVSSINAAQVNYTFANMALSRVPMRWVSRDVIEMLDQTDVPKQIYLGEGFPFANAILVFPQDTPIRFASFFHHSCEVDDPDEYEGLGAIVGLNRKEDGKSEIGFTFSRFMFDIKEDKINVDDCPDGIMSNAAWRLFLKTIAFCSVEDRVDSISTTSLRGFDVVSKGKKGKDTVRNPVWIDVKNPTTLRSHSRGSGSSSHGSPCTHWRSGHFRLQHYGEKRSKTKTIWIRPTLVGAGELA